MILLSAGPIPGSSSRDLSCSIKCAASSGHNNALREARRTAFCSGCFADSAATARSSAISALERVSILACLFHDLIDHLPHFFTQRQRLLFNGFPSSRKVFVLE